MIRVVRRARGLTYCRFKHSKSESIQSDDTPKKSPCLVKEEDMKNDWIGPPDPVSNLRPVKFHISKEDSSLAQSYRTQRQETQDWNQAFWSEHNTKFYEMKEEFVRQRLEEKMKEGSDSETLSAEEMSVFYKQFLDNNYKLHKTYNRDWYWRNFSLLWPALKLNMDKFKKRIMK
ncbi:COA8 family protein CBG23705, mitochondrial-like [Ylistrum balloti]|uniref:COA8 family protein CBG23705, mitochondrial-like n=1 Tax=Ylistrum balloti TaxID=509963 RepID=UPI0029058D4F|nr:COA8 family protein CBG23705, mitochondrial-like [Ylistrum balloti]